MGCKYRYTEDPDFEILLFGYSVDGGDVRVVDLACGETISPDIIAALTDDSVTKWAFNASFERICLSRYLSDMGISLDPFHDNHELSTELAKYLSPESWRCSMIWSAYMGMPLSLEGAGAVMGLEKQKLTEGKDLIKYFCQPCAPTKANGGRTRNLPAHAPDKWEQFKRYNARDVETEMGIQKRLTKFPVPESVWDEYHIDQEINDRGVRLDMELVHQAIAMDTRSRKELTAAMKRLTDLDNPNSVTQMKQWLADNGLETESLDKKAVAELLKTAPSELAEVLSLRQQLAKSSVKKYQAMENTVCSDGRARGMFQFYGANRSGRWAGRHIQLQNLPQNHLPDLAEARALVRQGDFDSVSMLYEDVPDTLSQLIRTAFIPKEGTLFYVADFSAIEARVIAWFAGETWRQEVFESGGDIYCASASQMFKVPVEKHGVNGHLRQKGKIAELALGYGGSVGALRAMEVKYNVTGARRKELAQVISKITGAKAEYQYMPTCAYEIDFFTLTKEGTLVFSDRSNTEIVEAVLDGIAEAGFECEAPAADTAAEETAEEESEGTEKSEHGADMGLTVAVPLDKVSVGNLTKLLDAKGNLIKKALGIDATPIEISEEAVSFPWFSEMPDADTVQAYTHFISALCQMSREQKRITATEKNVENEKYAFRCFLLRLGFIGTEYKTERKILLKNLTGSSAFKRGPQQAAELDGERTSSEVNELSALDGSERYGACEDEGGADHAVSK